MESETLYFMGSESPYFIGSETSTYFKQIRKMRCGFYFDLVILYYLFILSLLVE